MGRKLGRHDVSSIVQNYTEKIQKVGKSYSDEIRPITRVFQMTENQFNSVATCRVRTFQFGVVFSEHL